MTRFLRALARGATALVFGAATLLGQTPVPPQTSAPDSATFSPLGFLDLLSFERAYPAAPNHPLVLQATTARYWAFRGIAYRPGGEPAGAIWRSVGPVTNVVSSGPDGIKNVSGRVSALAISPHCSLTGPCRLWVGTAGGGVWRTDRAMDPDDPQWRWVSTGLATNSIGSLALDPSDRSGNTIYVGTGETNQPNNSGAGTGLYKSVSGGDRWTRVPTMIVDPAMSPVAMDFTFTRGIGAVVVDPRSPQTLFVATTSAMLGMTAVRGGQTQTPGFPQPRVGLYKTINGGATWSRIWTPPLDPVLPVNPHLGAGVGDTMFGVRDVRLDPQNPDIVYATAWNNAIHRSAPSLEGGDASFKPVFAIVGARRFRDLAMFDLTVKDGHTRLYVYNGTDDTSQQSLYRLDDADVSASALTTAAGGQLTNTSAWRKLSSNDLSHPGSTSRNICTSQCFYDLVVAVPPGEPDTVVLGGVQTPSFGEPTIRSTNAGELFNGFGRDAQNPRNNSHVDVRSVVFHPADPGIAFVGSDGGVVRNDGEFVDNSGLCATSNPPPFCREVLGNVPQRLYFLNKGLQTLQFYNVALDPRDPLRRMLGGLQDNSTIWMDGTDPAGIWKPLFPFGDGTSASGFHPSRPGVLFASFQSDRYFTNFRDGASNFWVRTDDPIRTSGERVSLTASTGRQFITFDPVRTDTQFTAFQHVWRTENNGGSQAFLETNCRFPGGVSGARCGDWVPLGVAYPFVSGSQPTDTSRIPGDLTSRFYGTDREGGLIVAVERTPASPSTLWAGTSFGRLFISTDADASGPDVQFVRIDDGALPNRFITRVFADPGDANVAFVSYSGFNTLTPARPGHVFRVTYDPSTERATFASVDFNLGDLPINTIAFDHLSGDLYAATDFGPLVLRHGTTTWVLAGVGFPEALMVDLEIVPERRVLVAATHGLGVFYTDLPPLGSLEPVRGQRENPRN